MGSLGSFLLTAVRGQIVCDGGPVVSGIVDFVVSRRRSLRLLSRLIERSTAAATALIVVNALRCFVGVRCPPGGGALVVARRPNERREVATLRTVLPDVAWTPVAFEWRLGSVLAALQAASRPLADLRRTARFSRRLIRRFGVFRALRVVELIAYYRRYVGLLDDKRFALAVMSSHSNPHGIGLNAAAHRRGIPVVLITHGMPVRPIARLDYELAIHECEASRCVYVDAGCRMNHTVIKSRRAGYRPLPQQWPERWSRVAICLSKDPAEDKVLASVRALLADPCMEQVLIRPHPINLWGGLADAIASLADARVGVHASSRLGDDLRGSELVLGGNSTVLLDALVSGTPACYVRGLDHGPHDVQDFVRDGLVYELPHLPPIDIAALASFYSRREWPAILRRYAAVDLDPDDFASAVRQIVGKTTGRLAGESTEYPAAVQPTARSIA
jgi:hypothetical protein